MSIFLERRIRSKLSSLCNAVPPYNYILPCFQRNPTATPTKNVTIDKYHGVSLVLPVRYKHQISPPGHVHRSTLLSPNFHPFPPTRIPLRKYYHYHHPTRNSHSTTVSPETNPCWKCGKGIMGGSEFGYLLCPSCGSPQKLWGNDVGVGVSGGPSFFSLLGEEESYSVNLERLAATTKRLQKRLHPDLFAGKGEEEQELSQEVSSHINKALSTLANPIERGRYLLELRGVKDPIGEIEKEITSEPKFLEEVMELNERLEELDSEQDWRQFREENDIVLKRIQSELNVAFKANKIDEAKILLARMKYFDTLQGKLKELKTKLKIVE